MEKTFFRRKVQAACAECAVVHASALASCSCQESLREAPPAGSWPY